MFEELKIPKLFYHIIITGIEFWRFVSLPLYKIAQKKLCQQRVVVWHIDMRGYKYYHFPGDWVSVSPGFPGWNLSLSQVSVYPGPPSKITLYCQESLLKWSIYILMILQLLANVPHSPGVDTPTPPCWYSLVQVPPCPHVLFIPIFTMTDAFYPARNSRLFTVKKQNLIWTCMSLKNYASGDILNADSQYGWYKTLDRYVIPKFGLSPYKTGLFLGSFKPCSLLSWGVERQENWWVGVTG